MAIQPIDLSTVYSQMDKMGQFNASQVQNAHMADRANVERLARQDSEKAKTVQESSKNRESNSIKNDVDQGGGAGQGLLDGGESAKKGNALLEDEEKPEAAKFYEIRDPNLGRHVDLLG